MVQAWIYNEEDQSDQREAHHLTPDEPVPLPVLRSLGVLYWRIDPSGCAEDPHKGRLGDIRKQRHYKNHDIITVSPDKLPNYEEKIRSFFEEHLHEDEEIRFVLEGTGYFDVRSDRNQRWIRIAVESGDMIVLPAGLYHRFTLDTKNYIVAMRLFQDAPKWEAINRGDKAESTDARRQYLEFNTKVTAEEDAAKQVTSKKVESVNGESFTLQSGARSLANYPHMRAYGGLLYISGISSRRADNTHRGAEKQADGSFKLDAAEQTAAVLDNISVILGRVGASLRDLLDITVFLVDMSDYAAINDVYNSYFPNPAEGPTRTTVAVKQLPHPNLRIEMKCVARDPRGSK